MAHPDLEALLNTLLPFTKTMLAEQKGFNPWGAVMYSDSKIQWVAADLGDEFPAAQAVIDTLTENFTEQAASGKIRAAGICFDGLAVPPGETQKTDAICCRLEHYSGESMDVLVPYLRGIGGDLTYGEIFTVKLTPSIFCKLPGA